MTPVQANTVILTRHAGEDRNPILAPDGQTLYFLSERNGGSFNVYAFPLAQPESVKAVTGFQNPPRPFPLHEQ